MDLSLSGEGALVVGGAKGIGYCIAEQFAKEGCNVVIWDIDPNVEESAKTLAESTGVETRGIIADATNYPQCEQLAKEHASESFNVQHVVYAAGAGSGKFGFPFWNLEPSDWPRIIDINLTGAVNITHAWVHNLKTHDSGSFGYITSVAGQIGSQTDPPYSAAKAALINWMQVVAKDVAAYGLRANCVSPGMVKTTINQSVWQSWYDQAADDERLDYDTWAESKIRNLSALGQWQTGDDIANAIVFLASNRARNMTGQTINVDGGWVLHS